MLQKLGLEHKLYLAVSSNVYNTIFKRKSVQIIVEWHQLSMIIVNVSQEEIVEWIN
jgi:hypothetical protein